MLAGSGDFFGASVSFGVLFIAVTASPAVGSLSLRRQRK
jgi:hypothetical protein